MATASTLVGHLFDAAAAVDVDDGFPVDSMRRVRDAGLLRAPLSRRHGGCGIGRPERLQALLQVLAHLGRGSLPVGRIYEGHVNALALIAAYGGDEQIERCAADAADGALFAVWNTQAQDGLRLLGSGSGRLRLEGSKTFATAAGFAARAVVTASDEDAANGWRMIVVPVDRTPPAIDRSFWKPLGMRASASFKADFSGIEVDRRDLLGAAGDYYRDPDFGSGAVRFAAVQLGGVEAVFDETRAFLHSIGRAGDAFQQARVGEMAMLVASGRQWLHGAALQAVASATPGGVPAAGAVHPRVAHANLMRSAIEAIALRVLQLAERSVGARGLLRPAPFERLHRDLTHYLRQAAPDAVIAAAGAHVLARPDPAWQLWGD